MKNYLIIGGIVLTSLIGVWLLAASSDDQADNNSNDTSQTPAEPEAFDPSSSAVDTTSYSSQYNVNLRLEYPLEWNLTEGTDNSADQQIVTFESPMDANGYYFCLDLTEVGMASQLDLSASPVSIKAVDSFMSAGVGKDLYSVNYVPDGSNALLWSITDVMPQLTDTEVAAQITNPGGRRLQTLGRFNCRADVAPALTTEQFTNSRWYHDARNIMLSLAY